MQLKGLTSDDINQAASDVEEFRILMEESVYRSADATRGKHVVNESAMPPITQAVIRMSLSRAKAQED